MVTFQASRSAMAMGFQTETPTVFRTVVGTANFFSFDVGRGWAMALASVIFFSFSASAMAIPLSQIALASFSAKKLPMEPAILPPVVSRISSESAWESATSFWWQQRSSFFAASA
ncbi:MAG TPA: hypothetical protein VEL08_02340 [Chthoniobacterales bacterium]|nr:hypothetical protein [Chthoniobacterales bacterium]